MKAPSVTPSPSACDAAFIIGLQRSAQQRGIPTQKSWRATGFNLRWWEGVDGVQRLTLNPGESTRGYLLRALNASQQQAWVSSAGCTLACYLSHYRLWQHCLAKNYRRVLIVEDDTTPIHSLHKIWSQLEALDDTFELIKLYGETVPKHLREASSRTDYALRHFTYNEGKGDVELHRPFRGVLGATAYVATHSALSKLVQHAMPAHMHVDNYMDRFEMHGVRVYLTLDAQVHTQPMTESDSSRLLDHPLPPLDSQEKALSKAYSKLVKKCKRDFLNFHRAVVVVSSPRGSFHSQKRIPPHFKYDLKKMVKDFIWPREVMRPVHEFLYKASMPPCSHCRSNRKVCPIPHAPLAG